jgi:hypothetical protein
LDQGPAAARGIESLRRLFLSLEPPERRVRRLRPRLRRPAMKALHQQMDRAIDAFVESHYYSETHEFESARRVFVESLCDGMTEVYRHTVLERLREDPSLVNILLCAGGGIPGAGSWLAARLDGETSASQVSRALIRVLADYPGEGEYDAVARFLDSEQEGEALGSLARMDWTRTLPILFTAAGKPALQSSVLHILHDRRKEVGLPALLQDLKVFATAHPHFDAAGLAQILTGTPAPYNPFSPEEVAMILGALKPARP